MSKQFYVVVAVVFAGFGAYETWLNLRLRALHEDAIAACVAPLQLPPAVGYFAAR